MMKLLRFGVFCIIFCLVVSSTNPHATSAAQSEPEIKWQAPRNLSNSPGKTSTDPFLVADPTGKVHLFWAEKMGPVEGNQPETLLYTVWNGEYWQRPVDLFFSPDSGGTPLVAYPRSVIDETGQIHLFWLAQPNFPNYALYYSNAPAEKASNAIEWKPEELLVDDLTGTKYSMDVKYLPPGELHVIFARVQQGASPPEERAISYIRSTDYGENWTDPIDIYSFNNVQHGGSDTHLIVDDNNNIFTTWTEWDGSGNGLRIWFCRSLDRGKTWKDPIVLSERLGNEYERDWSNLYLLESNKLVVMWEGGWRAYRHAQYSDDGGVTWSKPIDTFPWLIGENGTVEYARDSNNRLHLFIAQRVRESYSGYGDGTNAAVWHSLWQGNRKWSEPRIVTPAVNLINPKAVITGGNRVVLTWYTQGDLEIMVMTGEIADAPYITQTVPPKPLTTFSTEMPQISDNQVFGTPTTVFSTPLQENEQYQELAVENVWELIIGTTLVLVIIAMILHFLRNRSKFRKH